MAGCATRSRPLALAALAGLALAPATALGAQDATDIHLLHLQRVGDRLAVVGPPVAVTDRPGYDNQPGFTPDGRALLYTSIRDEQADTYRYDIATGASARVTRTPESEYSPTPIPGSDRFSVVRVEADGTQRLWSFAADGSDPRLVLPDVAPVGYHAWADAGTLALFVLGEPPTLRLAVPGPGSASIIVEGIGRAIQPVPGGRAVTFTQELDGEWWLRELDVGTGHTRSLARLLGPDTYHAHTPGGDILAAHGSRIYQLLESGEWAVVGDLADHGLHGLSRLAVAPDGVRLAVVADRATPPSSVPRGVHASTRTSMRPGAVGSMMASKGVAPSRAVPMVAGRPLTRTECTRA
jgi:hypothetical protein